MMNLQAYTEQQLIEAERLAVKYTPSFALELAREYNKRKKDGRICANNACQGVRML